MLKHPTFEGLPILLGDRITTTDLTGEARQTGTVREIRYVERPIKPGAPRSDPEVWMFTVEQTNTIFTEDLILAHEPMEV